MIAKELKTILDNYLRLAEDISYADYIEDTSSYYIVMNDRNEFKDIHFYKIQIYQDNEIKYTLFVNQDLAVVSLNLAVLYPAIIDNVIEERRIYIQQLFNQSLYFLGSVDLTRVRATYSIIHKSGREVMIRTISNDLQEILNYDSYLNYIDKENDIKKVKEIVDKIKQTAATVAL